VLDLIGFDNLTSEQQDELYAALCRLHGQKVRAAVVRRTTPKERARWAAESGELVKRLAQEAKKEGRPFGRPGNPRIKEIMAEWNETHPGKKCSRQRAHQILQKEKGA